MKQMGGWSRQGFSPHGVGQEEVTEQYGWLSYSRPPCTCSVCTFLSRYKTLRPGTVARPGVPVPGSQRQGGLRVPVSEQTQAPKRRAFEAVVLCLAFLALLDG
jgi:hypothetical protein